MSLQNIIIEGRIIPMAILTIVLAILVIARFKSHSWVKYIGIGALVISIFLATCTFISASATIVGLDDSISVSQTAWTSVHTACIDMAYGLLIYLVSLIFRGQLKSKKRK